jgi:hypothetical protein
MRTIIALAAVLALVTSAALAAEPKIEVVLEGLDNPCSVAIQPGTGDVFVSDSGAGRVVRVSGGKAEDVIVGSPLDVYGKGPMYNIGPLGLAFLDKDTLAVGDGGYVDGMELLRLYKVPAAGSAAVKFDETAATAGPLPDAGELKAEGNFYALAVTKNAIYVTSNGDDTKGWVLRAEINGTKLGALERFLATKEAVQVDAPVGITLSKRGELVVGQMGEINVPEDSLLSFYSPKDGKLLMNLQTGLYDIAGLAYSPKGSLYAVDFAWMAPEKGGLFRLDAVEANGKQSVKAVKIAALDKPSSLAFGSDGSLYVTVFGTAAEGDSKKPGKLLKFASGL